MAAEQGFADGQYVLGNCYHSGNGVPKDDLEAIFWWKLAAANNHESARYIYEKVSRELTEEELQQLQARAEKWIAEHGSVKIVD